MNTLRDRTKAFAVRIVRVAASLPATLEGRVIAHQVIRAGTSPGAHCREAHRARSDAEMISKFETALQELDETQYWLELLIEAEIVPAERLSALLQEADEIAAILVASVRTLKRRRGR